MENLCVLQTQPYLPCSNTNIAHLDSRIVRKNSPIKVKSDLKPNQKGVDDLFLSLLRILAFHFSAGYIAIRDIVGDTSIMTRNKLQFNQNRVWKQILSRFMVSARYIAKLYVETIQCQ